jgi:hypothetical protein
LTKLKTSSRMVSPTFAVNSRGSSNCDVADTPSCWARKGSHTGAKSNRTLSIPRLHADSGTQRHVDAVGLLGDAPDRLLRCAVPQAARERCPGPAIMLPSAVGPLC